MRLIRCEHFTGLFSADSTCEAGVIYDSLVWGRGRVNMLELPCLSPDSPIRCSLACYPIREEERPALPAEVASEE